MSRTVRLLRRARTAVLFVAFSLVVFLVGALIVVPRATGAVPLNVLTGSMRPTVAPGSVVVVRAVELDDLEVGDVITFQPRSGDAAVVTHRIVGISHSANDTTFTTKGDNNGAADPEPVRFEQVRGKVWYTVPFVGHLTNRLDLGERGVATRLVAGALLAWATWPIGTAARDHWRGRTTQRAGQR